LSNSNGVRLAKLVIPVGSGFVIMIKEGLRCVHGHLFTIKPDPEGKFCKPDPVGTKKNKL
jgi:hypothetical protein